MPYKEYAACPTGKAAYEVAKRVGGAVTDVEAVDRDDRCSAKEPKDK